MKTKNIKITAVAIAVAGVATLSPLLSNGKDKPTGALLSEKVRIDSKPLAREGGMAKSYADVVDKVAPSVVSISTSKMLRQRAYGNIPDELLPYYGIPRGANRPQSTPTGLGSGVVITSDGYILTNNHVVQGADEVKVTLDSSHQEYIAEVIGTDPESDVAVVKIDAKDLPAITVADSTKARVGDVVLAFGNPFGLRQTVSMGIVSGLGRSDIGIANYADFIQTDASINPGNSGGALVDADGRLLGINTAIFSQTGGSVGIGFAIPVNMALDAADDLMHGGAVKRGFLGINMIPMNTELARELKADVQDGAVVAEVVPNTPADRAGLRMKDIIIEADGEPVTDASKLRLGISKKDPGTAVKFKVVREGREKILTAVLSERSEPYRDYGENSDTAAAPAEEKESEKVELVSGVHVEDLTEELREQLRIDSRVDGLVVTGVDGDAPRMNARLAPGDIVLEIDRQPVTSVKDLNSQSGAGRVLVRVLGSDGDTRLYVLQK
jgi:serine protease Do